MSSNYDYEYLANLNSLNPEVPVMSEEELARHLDCWINAEFPQYDVLTAVDTKLEDQETQPSMVLQTLTEQSQQYPLFAFPTTNSFLPNNFTSIFPAPAPVPIAPVTIPTNVNNPILLPKEPTENPTKATPPTTSNITTEPTATVTTTKTTATTTSNSSTGGTTTSPNRKNSLVKSSNTETKDESDKTKDEEKVDPELAAKLAAEEDKRRRNTAASARFRVKKKLREQALERTAREMTSKAETLEGRVKELEMEIKWLRSLIVEKDARLLDIDRPGKKRKKDEIDDEGEKKKEEEVVKQEQSDQTSQRE